MTRPRDNGRSTGHRTYRTNKTAILTQPGGDICGICGHGGAATTDHIISHKNWPRGPDGKLLPGFHDPANLQPAHGTMANHAPPNRCPTCGQLCNQSKGAGGNPRHQSPRSRQW